MKEETKEKNRKNTTKATPPITGASSLDIKEILLRGHYVSEEDIKRAEEYAKKHRTSLAEYFLVEGLLTRDLLGQAMAENFGVPYADLNSYPPSREQILKVPEEIARKFNVVLWRVTAEEVIITTTNPKSSELLAELKKIFQTNQ